ncbi:PAN domain-containing protein [Photobacterium damselae]|uniref:PAN domain-containing protein n=1 Tax=Photobacterium damselae TaxID=38293 RepID=UPI0030F37D87
MRLINRKSIMMSAVVLAISGCGGGDGDSTSTDKPLPIDSVTALNGLTTAKVNNATAVDFTPYVMGKGAQLATIISSEPDRCLVDSQSGLSANMTITQAGRCDYSYTVSNMQGEESSAEMVVVSSSLADPVLTPVSVATSIEQPNIVINLKSLLKDEIPDGYILSDSFVIQAAQGSSNGTVTKSGDLDIRYTAPNALGWNYIAYTLTNGAGDALIGHVFVSIADEINTPPVINPQEFIYPNSVMLNEVVTIDLTTLVGLDISDDSGTWQLSNVKAIGANVSPVNPNDVNNKSFTFTASKIGAYDVAYIISDHTGGFTMGVIRINVDRMPITPTKGWNDITTCGRTYIAPLIHSEAINYNNDHYNEESISDKTYQVSVWGNNLANHYCAQIGGRLPTQQEMTDLYTTKDAQKELIKWPKKVQYFTYNNGGYALFDLESGLASPMMSGYKAYVTCVDKGLATLSVEPQYNSDENTTSESVIAGKELTLKATLVAKKDNLPIKGVNITPKLDTHSNPIGYYFDLKRNTTLSITAKEITTLSLGECVDKCLSTTSYQCKAAEYNRLNYSCKLYDIAPDADNIVAAEPHNMVYLRNNLLKGVEKVDCPTPTDANGETECQYSNTIAGEFGVDFTAEQGLGVENATTQINIKVAPEIKTAFIKIQPDMDTYILGKGIEKRIAINQVDAYGNNVSGINAKITGDTGTYWSLNNIHGNKPSISYPHSYQVELKIQGDEIGVGELNLEGINNTVSRELLVRHPIATCNSSVYPHSTKKQDDECILISRGQYRGKRGLYSHWPSYEIYEKITGNRPLALMARGEAGVTARRFGDVTEYCRQLSALDVGISISNIEEWEPLQKRQFRYDDYLDVDDLNKIIFTGYYTDPYSQKINSPQWIVPQLVNSGIGGYAQFRASNGELLGATDSDLDHLSNDVQAIMCFAPEIE